MTSCDFSTAAFRSRVVWILERICVGFAPIEAALRDELREAVLYHRHAPVDELLLDVEQGDVVSGGLRADLRYPVPHEAGAEHGHLSDLGTHEAEPDGGGNNR